MIVLVMLLFQFCSPVKYLVNATPLLILICYCFLFYLSINKYILYKAGNRKPFLCTLCRYRSTILSLLRRHLVKRHECESLDRFRTRLCLNVQSLSLDSGRFELLYCPVGLTHPFSQRPKDFYSFSFLIQPLPGHRHFSMQSTPLSLERQT